MEQKNWPALIVGPVTSNEASEPTSDCKTKNSVSKAPAPKLAYPDLDVVEHQLNTSTSSNYDTRIRSKLMKGAHSLYHSLAPTDPIESIIVRQIVGLNNLTMDCIDRAMRSSSPAARDVDLRYTIKSVTLTAELIMLLERRRGLGLQDVPVGNRNVRSGAMLSLPMDKPETGEGRRQHQLQFVV